MGKCIDICMLLFNIFLVYYSYTSVIKIIEYYEGNIYLTSIITWLSNFLMPFAFAVFVNLKFNMLEILQIINFVSNTLFYFIPIIFLLATAFSVLLFFLPDSYDQYLILGIKIYLGALAILCIGFLIKKSMKKLLVMI